MNNDNNIYKLYKLIFNNIILSKKIFKYVRFINKKSIDSEKRYKYNQVSYEWILKNKHFHLLKDKIKMGIKMEFNEITYSNLITIIRYLNEVDNDYNYYLLNKFYKTNKDNFSNILFSSTETFFINIGVVTLSIFSQVPIFVELLFTDYLNENNNDNKNNRDNNIILNSREFIENFIFSVNDNNKNNNTLNESLLDISLKLGSIEIIKFLHEKIGLPFRKEISLYWAVFSENRNQVIKYIYHKFGNDFKIYIPKLITGFEISTYYSNLLKLDHSMFKIIPENNPQLVYSKHILKPIINVICKNTILNIHLNDHINNNNLLNNFIQNCYYLLSKINRNSSYGIILKKIYHLIEYNNIHFKINNFLLENDKKKDFFTFLRSFSGQSFYDPTVQFTKNNHSILPINYKDFNIEREIKRIFIFEYLVDVLKQDKIDTQMYDAPILIVEKPTISSSIWPQLVFKFASTYNEYHLIEQYIL